jgi:hypothetical protein
MEIAIKMGDEQNCDNTPPVASALRDLRLTLTGRSNQHPTEDRPFIPSLRPVFSFLYKKDSLRG